MSQNRFYVYIRHYRTTFWFPPPRLNCCFNPIRDEELKNVVPLTARAKFLEAGDKCVCKWPCFPFVVLSLEITTLLVQMSRVKCDWLISKVIHLKKNTYFLTRFSFPPWFGRKISFRRPGRHGLYAESVGLKATVWFSGYLITVIHMQTSPQPRLSYTVWAPSLSSANATC